MARLSGVTSSTLSKWRNDPQAAAAASEPSVSRIAQFLGIPVTQLWDGPKHTAVSPGVSRETDGGVPSDVRQVLGALWAFEDMMGHVQSQSRRMRETLVRVHGLSV